MISRSRFSQKSQDSDRIVAVFDTLRCDSGPGVGTVEIYVENHDGENQEFVIWIRFDNTKLGEQGSLPYLREDHPIYENCPLEESASHHVWQRRFACGKVLPLYMTVILTSKL